MSDTSFKYIKFPLKFKDLPVGMQGHIHTQVMEQISPKLLKELNNSEFEKVSLSADEAIKFAEKQGSFGFDISISPFELNDDFKPKYE